MKTIYIVGGIALIFLLVQSYKVVSSSLDTERQKYRLVRTASEFQICFYPGATFDKSYSNGTDYKSVASRGLRK